MKEKNFFRALFLLKKTEEKIRFCPLKKIKGKYVKDKEGVEFFNTIDEFLTYLKENLQRLEREGYNIYFNPAFFKPEAKQGGNENVAGSGCVFVDVDFEESISIEKVKEKVAKFKEKCPLKPTAIIFSGNKGFHCYWLFEDRLNQEQFTEIQKYWNVYLRENVEKNVDPACKDIQRLIRLLGSLHPTSKKKCEILEFYPNLKYKLTDFQEYVNKVKIEEFDREIPLMHSANINTDEIINTVKYYWKRGRRQSLALYLAGFLYKIGVEKEVTKQIISEICRETRDEETKQRLNAVEETYKKDRKDIAGASGIVDILKEELSEEGAIYIVKKLSSTIDSFTSSFEIGEFKVYCNKKTKKWGLVGEDITIQNKKIPATPKELKKILEDYLIKLNDSEIKQIFEKLKKETATDIKKRVSESSIYYPIEKIRKLDKIKWKEYLEKKKIIRYEMDNRGREVEKIDRDGSFNYIVNDIFKDRYFTFVDTEDTYVYDEGIWRKLENAEIKNIIYTILRKKAFRNLISEVIDRVKYSKVLNRKDIKIPTTKICLENGVLDIETYELKEFSPNYYFFNKLPLKYDPNADCPEIKKAVKLSLPDKRDFNAFFELAGYLLLNENPLQKLFVFLGEGNEGKSVLISLLENFVGRENTTAIPLQDLATDKHYCRSTLFGKRLCSYADIPKYELSDMSFIKAMTGGDLLKARTIYGKPFDFRFTGKSVYSANEPPAISEDNTAVWRRIHLFIFTQEIPDEVKDENIIKKLTTQEELSGLLNEALKGLKRLLENKQFSNKKERNEIRDIYLRRSDSVYNFVEECIISADIKKYVLKKQLYTQYLNFCSENNFDSVGEKKFTERFLKQKNVPYRRLTSGNNKGQYAFFGIKVAQSETSEESEESEGYSRNPYIRDGDKKVLGKPFTCFTNFTARQGFIEKFKQFLLENQKNGKDFGVSIDKVREFWGNLAEKEGELEQFLQFCKKEALIYESKPGFYATIE